MWDFSSKVTEMVFNTWNTSIRKMLRLDRCTHRYFIEPLSDVQHVKTALMKRFIKFTDALSCSSKIAARNLLQTVKTDCRSITGRNLRSIMLFCGKNNPFRTSVRDINGMVYHPTQDQEKWRISIVKELLDIRDHYADGVEWKHDEVLECINYLCTT